MLNRHAAGTQRTGFTLIELLVAIAIVALLVALITPAVQSVREAARKAQCIDHLHNIGTALHSFSLTHSDRLPLLGVPQGHPGEFRSWTVAILPQLEQKPIYDLLADPMYDPSGDHVPVYLCPSDTSTGIRPNELSYVANAGYAGRASSTATPTWLKGSTPSTMVYSNWHLIGSSDGGRETGLFWVDGNPIGLNEVTVRDGTSNTLMIAENCYATQWTHKIWRMHPPNTTPDRTTEFEITEVAFLIGDDGIQLGNETTMNSPVNPTTLTIHATKLDHYGINYAVRNNVQNDGFRPAPNSRHPGGVVVVYADVHTDFLSENMDEAVYAKAITWGGGLKKENEAGNGGGRGGPPTRQF